MEFVASGSLACLLRRAGTLREPVVAMYNTVSIIETRSSAEVTGDPDMPDLDCLV
jgi:hypothetical protein